MLQANSTIEVLMFVSGHNHLREGELLPWIVEAERYYSYLVAMGNKRIPTDTAELSLGYVNDIRQADAKFITIPTLMLTNRTTREVIREAAARGIKAVKLTPGGTSTNSDEGISLFDLISTRGYGLIEEIVTNRMLLLIHAELIKDKRGRIIDERDRCARALAFLEKIVHDFPDLRLVVEHANDRQTINFVRGSQNVWASLRPHDAILTYGDVCGPGGEIINPLNYAKPIAKSKDDRVAVLEAIVGGEDYFFYGPDSAPWLMKAKMRAHKACIFLPSFIAVPLVVQIFERANAMHNLYKYTVDVARRVYGLPQIIGHLTLKKERQRIPESCHGIPLFLAGRTLDWQIVE